MKNRRSSGRQSTINHIRALRSQGGSSWKHLNSDESSRQAIGKQVSKNEEQKIGSSKSEHHDVRRHAESHSKTAAHGKPPFANREAPTVAVPADALSSAALLQPATSTVSPVPAEARTTSIQDHQNDAEDIPSTTTTSWRNTENPRIPRIHNDNARVPTCRQHASDNTRRPTTDGVRRSIREGRKFTTSS